jgi:hypothetical protein
LATGRYSASLLELANHADSLDARRDLCRLDKLLLRDEWGTPLRYRVRAAAPEISAAGPDRVFGTGDDIRLPTVGDSLGFVIAAQCDCGLRSSPSR